MNNKDTLDHRFKLALDAITFMKQTLVKARNSDDFHNETKETQDNVTGALEDLKKFQIKNTDWKYTDEEKESLIVLVLQMYANIFGVKP